MVGSGDARRLRGEVADREWYHTLELAPGIITPGWFDTRPVADRLPWPDLAGRRCLDVGTFDGYWAFAMEERGADEVVAIDVLDPAGWDWPAGTSQATVTALGRRKRGGVGFVLAHQALGSRVARRELSVYDLDPGDIGEFDFVFVGSLLMHLRDPVGALMRVRAVCRGELLVVDNHDLLLSRLLPRTPLARLDGAGRPWWWRANVAAIVRMLKASGFSLTQAPMRLLMPAGRGQPGSGRGDPHVALLAR
jgi:tRNA (mo5U34)-methyltransferase